MLKEHGNAIDHLTTEEYDNLESLYVQKEYIKKTNEDKIKTAQEQQNIYLALSDEDQDGDIDEDDFLHKYGETTTGLRGGTTKKIDKQKYTQQKIDEVIEKAQIQQTIERARIKPITEDTQKKVFESVGEGTKFTGETAGQTQEIDINKINIGSITDQKNNVINKFNEGSNTHRQNIENTLRNRKKIDNLKNEIRCFHTLYDDLIPEFKESKHTDDKNDVLKSDNIDSVIEHHTKMSERIALYYKTSELKLGVILSAESIFGDRVGDIPSVAGSYGLGLPVNRGQKPITIPKGKDRFSKAMAGDINIIRGGINSKRGVSRAVPTQKINNEPKKDHIPTPNYSIDDSFRPRSFRRNRVRRNPNVFIKT
tara:strand:- start:949 stop:2049 length:1101 start_codon:yes stop_codon:yes gene_type:complete